MKIRETFKRLFRKRHNISERKNICNPVVFIDGFNGQTYFLKECIKDRTPKSKQHFVSCVVPSKMHKVINGFSNGNEKLLIVRKTVDDLMARVVVPGSSGLTNGTNHKLIWNKYYERNIAAVLYCIGFNNIGMADASWIFRHRNEISSFLKHIKAIGGSFQTDENGEFESMSWGQLKHNSWLLYYDFRYRKLPPQEEIKTPLFEYSDEQRRIQDACKPSDKPKPGKDHYLKRPSQAQIRFANAIYFTLHRLGYIIERPNFATSGTVGAFIGKWFDRFEHAKKKYRRYVKC